MNNDFNIPNPVKLIIWDLDETFWKGTLSEEGIAPIPTYIELIKTLTDRGIICSICSKNNFEDVKKVLTDLGIWDYFVFPHIEWSPKGVAIKNTILQMGLRAENVLFLDDNHMNLEEAKHFNPEIMCLDGTLDFTNLLEHRNLKGKNDLTHSRLTQYKLLEAKSSDQIKANLSNEDFLRTSGIKIEFILDIDDKMDRVYEILNRTNQLNFTKIRANTDEEKQNLKKLLDMPSAHFGLVRVVDNYGDYGIVGFYLFLRRAQGDDLFHFAFSCRTLNMGVENWVWHKLGQPNIQIKGPVSGSLEADKKIDWITLYNPNQMETNQIDSSVCLVGGCDLLQVSYYCGTTRHEFVVTQDEKNQLVRHDDFGFLLNNRNISRPTSERLKTYAGWGQKEMLAFDQALSESDIVLFSLIFAVLNPNNFSLIPVVGDETPHFSMPPRRLNSILSDRTETMRFIKSNHFQRIDLNHKLNLLNQAIERTLQIKKTNAPVFILGAVLGHGIQAERTYKIREQYNKTVQSLCLKHNDCTFVDIDTLLDQTDFVDSDHYTRNGYFKIAQFILQKTKNID